MGKHVYTKVSMLFEKSLYIIRITLLETTSQREHCPIQNHVTLPYCPMDVKDKINTYLGY
jgi:hypothetical protein